MTAHGAFLYDHASIKKKKINSGEPKGEKKESNKDRADTRFKKFRREL